MKNQSITNLFETLLTEMVNFTYVPTDYVGKTTRETHKDEAGYTWYTTTFKSNDGSYTQTTSYKTKEGVDTHPYAYLDKKWFGTKNWNTTPSKPETKTSEISTTIAELNYKLKTAVETQNFEDAVKYRNEIRDYEKTDSEVKKLKVELNNYISTQNFEKAIEVRDRIKKIEKTK